MVRWSFQDTRFSEAGGKTLVTDMLMSRAIKDAVSDLKRLGDRMSQIDPYVSRPAKSIKLPGCLQCANPPAQPSCPPRCS